MLFEETIKTRKRAEMMEITARVAAIVGGSGVQEGICVVCVPHTTAGVTINENADPDVKHDVLKKLEELAPKHEAYYKHGEGNSDSHLKTAMVGNSVTVIIEGGRLLLGTWQGIQFCEFDGPRKRIYHVKVMRG